MTGRQALTDMRRLVAVPGEGEESAPLPRLEQLDSLVEEVRSAGLAVELTVEGDRDGSTRVSSFGLSDHPGGTDQFTETCRRWSDDGHGSLRCGRFGDHDRGRARGRYPAGP